MSFLDVCIADEWRLIGTVYIAAIILCTCTQI